MADGQSKPLSGEQRSTVQDAPPRSMVSLFSGIGGLDVGLEHAGFQVRWCVEHDETARRALKTLHPEWPLDPEGDVSGLDARGWMKSVGLRAGDLDLLAAGPPCQPFSHASAWRQAPSRIDDDRVEPFRALFRTVAAQLKPRVILLENVPSLGNDAGQRWLRTWFRLLNKAAGTAYSPSFVTLNAVEHGVPQCRRRLFVVAERSGRSFAAPTATHHPPEAIPPGGQRYVTAWDAIGTFEDDPDPRLRCTGRWADLLPSIPEGLNYYHHTPQGAGLPLFGYRTRYWSFLLKLAKDRPAWTLPASPGPATGPFHWKSRKLSARELAALQTIPLPRPLDLPLHVAQRLLGNAVPGALGELMGFQVRTQLFGEALPWQPRLVPAPRDDCPPPIPPASVPSRFAIARSAPEAHPGAGRGPRPWQR